MKKELWLRLTRYHFDHLVPPHLLDHVAAAFGGSDASTKAFASKLSRKLGWTSAFSQQVIGEYKKFLYMGVVSDFPVTPSRVIDQIWHEHLLFSRGYREFCRDILQHDFDHNPELVPSDDQTSVFSAQYTATLSLYEAEFNMRPPEAIWGSPKFASDAKPQGNRDGRPVRGVRSKEVATRRNGGDGGASTSGRDDVPLFLMFDGSGAPGAPSHDASPEFGGGGSSGGGGGTSWGESDSAGAGSDPGDSGSSSDGGGSGCSSGCGGGGD